MNGKFLEKVKQTFGCVPEVIEKAYYFATKMHDGVKRVRIFALLSLEIIIHFPNYFAPLTAR